MVSFTVNGVVAVKNRFVVVLNDIFCNFPDGRDVNRFDGVKDVQNFYYYRHLNRYHKSHHHPRPNLHPFFIIFLTL